MCCAAILSPLITIPIGRMRGIRKVSNLDGRYVSGCETAYERVVRDGERKRRSTGQLRPLSGKGVAEDLRILDVVSWQNWVAAAPGGYRDGLVYINRETQEYCETKRSWSFGNFSRFVRPGYVRIGITGDNEQQESCSRPPLAAAMRRENGSWSWCLSMRRGGAGLLVRRGGLLPHPDR